MRFVRCNIVIHAKTYCDPSHGWHGSVLRIATSAIGAHKADVPPTKLMGQAGDISSRFLEIKTLKTAYRDTQPRTAFHSYAGACMPPLCPRFLDKTAEGGLPGSGAGHQQDQYDRLRDTIRLEEHSLE
jgi:hypothetical protein